MNKKIKRMFEPNLRLYFILLVLFAIATFIFFQHAKVIAIIEI